MGRLKNSRWWDAAGTRALKTVCQTAVAMIGTGALGILDVDWLGVLSVCILAGIVSILTSIGGLPEVDLEEQIEVATVTVDRRDTEEDED